MALREDFQALPSEVFDGFENVSLACVLKRPARPRTNTLGAQVDAAEQWTTRCIFTSVSRFDRTTGLFRDWDALALIPASELATEPAPGDRLSVDGQTWAVGEGGVSSDEVKALWTLQLKRITL